jgi:carbonic anhydrase
MHSKRPFVVIQRVQRARELSWLAALALPVLVALVLGAEQGAVNADTALSELKAGNDHHASKKYDHPHQTVERQRELTKGQHPHAAVLSCADSRVAPEIVFDQGLGDIFDVRVAGNVATDSEIASLEYAAEHLDVPLIVVMGHQMCGAVTAALEAGEGHGHLPVLINAIRPAVDRASKMPGDKLSNAVRVNVQMVIDQLRGSKPILAPMVASGKVRIVGGVYSLDSGRFEWLPASGPAK